MFFLFALLLLFAGKIFSMHEAHKQAIYTAISPKSQYGLEKKLKITPAQLITLKHVSSAEGEHSYVSKTGFFVSSGLFSLGLAAVYFSKYYYGLPFIGAAAVYTLFKRAKASEELIQDQVRIQKLLDSLKKQNTDMTEDEFATLCWRMV